MTPTNYMRWHQFHVNNEIHGFAIPYSPSLGLYIVLQQWWHENGEPPPSSNGEWRDVGYME